MSIRPGQAKGPYVGVSGSGGGGGGSLTEADVFEGNAIKKTTVDTDKVEIASSVAGFRDDFTSEKDFWQGKEVLTSGAYTIDTANEWMQGNAASGGDKTFREHIKGDFDYEFHMQRNGTSSMGPAFVGNAITAELELVGGSGGLEWRVTGETTQIISYPIDDAVYIRVYRRGNTVGAAYRASRSESWTFFNEYTKLMGDDVEALLDISPNGRYYEVRFWDSQFPWTAHRSTPTVVREIGVSGGYTPDALLADQYELSLSGNIVLDNPVNATENGQLLIFRIQQSGFGGNIIAFGTKYRFSTSLPQPNLSTGASEIDYLGFRYSEFDDKWDYIAEVKGF